jgi:hypothetical protein
MPSWTWRSGYRFRRPWESFHRGLVLLHQTGSRCGPLLRASSLEEKLSHGLRINSLRGRSRYHTVADGVVTVLKWPPALRRAPLQLSPGLKASRVGEPWLASMLHHPQAIPLNGDRPWDSGLVNGRLLRHPRSRKRPSQYLI